MTNKEIIEQACILCERNCNDDGDDTCKWLKTIKKKLALLDIVKDLDITSYLTSLETVSGEACYSVALEGYVYKEELDALTDLKGIEK